MGKLKKKIKKIIKNMFAKKEPVIIQITSSEELKGKNAIITGGSSGIGYAIAESFLSAGAKVIITGRNEKKLQESKTNLENLFPNRVYYYVLDNNNIKVFSTAIIEMEALIGEPIHILVNNAGTDGKSRFPYVSESDYDIVMGTNLKGPFFLAQEFSKYLIDKKINGNILNVGSSSCYRPGTNPYILSKWGIRSLTLGLAKTLIGYGIVVNGIAPGPTATAMLTDDINNITEPRNPSGRYATVQEVASLATKLVSDSARMMVGEMVGITGGAGVITFDD